MTATPNRLTAVSLKEPGINPRNVPAYVAARALAANTAESITVPSVAAPNTIAYVRIAATADLYYSFAGVATVPGDTDDGSACELLKLNGGAEYLMIPPGASALSVISAGTPVVTASFYTA